MLLVAGYANGHRRKRINGKRVPLRLPEPLWFLQRLSAHGLQDELHRVSGTESLSAISLTQASVAGFVILGPGHVREGHLTPWPREADLLWDYLSRPLGCFTMEVKQMYLLDPQPTVSSARGIVGNISLVHAIFQTNTQLVSLDTLCHLKITGVRVSIGSVLEF